MIYDENISDIVILMSKKKDFLHKKLRSAPKGSIQIVKEGRYLRINQILSENGKVRHFGIRQKPELARSLLNKNFIKEYNDRLDYDLGLLTETLNSWKSLEADDILKCMPKNYDLLPAEYRIDWRPSQMNPSNDTSIPIVDYTEFIPEAEREGWATRPYRVNTIGYGEIKNKTLDGIYKV